MGLAHACAAAVTTGAFVLSAAPAAAGLATYTMPVEVTVTNACTVSAAPLVFIAPNPVNADIDSTSTITVSCPPNIPYIIQLDNGLWPQGNNRRVKHTNFNDFLRYDIYRNPPRSQIWGRGNTRQLNGNSGPTGTVVYPVYGRLTARASMRAGAYRDSVVVEVTF